MKAQNCELKLCVPLILCLIFCIKHYSLYPTKISTANLKKQFIQNGFTHFHSISKLHDFLYFAKDVRKQKDHVDHHLLLKKKKDQVKVHSEHENGRISFLVNVPFNKQHLISGKLCTALSRMPRGQTCICF